MPPDTCPLCGTRVALRGTKNSPSEPDALSRRIETLRQRGDDLEQGEVTPRQLKDDVLWMCADCQRVMTDLPALDRAEIQRRIHDLVGQLERRRETITRRAG